MDKLQKKRLKGHVIDITKDGYAIIKVAVNINQIVCGNVKDCYVTFADDYAPLYNQEDINIIINQCSVVYNSKMEREAKRIENSVCKMAQSGLHGEFVDASRKIQKGKIDLRLLHEIEICLNCPYPDCSGSCERFKREKGKFEYKIKEKKS